MDITSERNVTGMDIASDRNLHGTDIRYERNVQGMEITLMDIVSHGLLSSSQEPLKCLLFESFPNNQVYKYQYVNINVECTIIDIY